MRFQKTLAQSAKAVIESTIQALGVGSEFRVFFDKIETPGGGLIIFLGMQDQNAELIKSLEGYDIAWVEEKLNPVSKIIGSITTRERTGRSCDPSSLLA